MYDKLALWLALHGLIHSDGLDSSLKQRVFGISMTVQWLRLHASNAGGAGSIPGQRTRIPHAAGHGQKEKKQRVFSATSLPPKP